MFGGTLTDTFTYRIDYGNGTVETAEFNVFVTASGEGVPEVVMSESTEPMSASVTMEASVTFEAAVTDDPAALNMVDMSTQPLQSVALNTDTQLVTSETEAMPLMTTGEPVESTLNKIPEDTITLPEEEDIVTTSPVEEVTIDAIDIELPPEEVVLPSIEPSTLDTSSELASVSGAGEMGSDSSTASSGDVGASSSTESEILRTAIDKLPPTDI